MPESGHHAVGDDGLEIVRHTRKGIEPDRPLKICRVEVNEVIRAHAGDMREGGFGHAPTLPGWIALPDHVLDDGQLSQILNLRKHLNEIYVKHTGQPIEKIEEAMERDTFLTAEAAKEFGLVDKVIEQRLEEGCVKNEPDFARVACGASTLVEFPNMVLGVELEAEPSDEVDLRLQEVDMLLLVMHQLFE